MDGQHQKRERVVFFFYFNKREGLLRFQNVVAQLVFLYLMVRCCREKLASTESPTQ